jgi:regulator of sigma E protease
MYKLDYSSNKLLAGSAHTINTFLYNISALSGLFKKSYEQGNLNPVSENTGSIVKAGQVTYQLVRSDNLLDILNLIGLINISLAFFNILPIPPLDGGHVMFETLTLILGKKIVRPSWVEKINVGCFALLMILSVFLIFKDVLDLNFVRRILGR